MGSHLETPFTHTPHRFPKKVFVSPEWLFLVASDGNGFRHGARVGVVYHVSGIGYRVSGIQ